MRLRPDFTRTATGWVWLDWLTLPYWAWADRRASHRLYRLLGRGDEAEGKQLFEDALRETL